MTAIGVVVACGVATVATHAVVTQFTDENEWFKAVGPVTTIGFTKFPDNMFITDEYENLGVLFADGIHQISCCGGGLDDGAALHGFPAIHLAFLQPQGYLAVDFGGVVKIQLFNGGELIHDSSPFDSGLTGGFAGFASTELFDAALICDQQDNSSVGIDDLYFGVAGPAGDLDGDWLVGVLDLLLLLGEWGPCPVPPDLCTADIDGDGIAGVGDLLIVLANWSP